MRRDFGSGFKGSGGTREEGMDAQNVTAVPGPGRGPGGSPMAIAISPVLTDRDAFGPLRQKILDAAPGSRLIPVSAEGIADDPLDEVEVLLRGWSLGGDALDRLLGRAPRLRWIHSVSVGVAPDAGRLPARPDDHQRPRCLRPPYRRVRLDDDPVGLQALASVARAAPGTDVAADRGDRNGPDDDRACGVGRDRP